MKKFIQHSILWAVLLIGSMLVVFLSVDGTSDPFYLKFTTPKQSGLVLGSSIAGLAVNPSVLKENGVESPIYNYAFAAPLSPYGPSYLRAIKAKLDPKTKNGIFIITVEPLAISSDAVDPNDTLYFEEREGFLGKLSSFNSNPNFDYLLNHYNDYNFKFLWNKSVATLEDTGWMDVNIPKADYTKEDQIEIDDFKRTLDLYQFSETRLNFLKKTIAYLEDYGDVYLVRLPKHEKYIAVENEFMPQFEEKLDEISKQFNIPYLSMAPNGGDFDYYDGVHVGNESSEKVSKIIANFITSKKQPL
ncbi:MAG: hypothetical protein ACSHW7_00825 [Patiriisocius sp.]|uniref:hypothetical protein n=1 Tax=Patiriisocius sp. TaxID=2822396 RepID=UPI003EF7241F